MGQTVVNSPPGGTSADYPPHPNSFTEAAAQLYAHRPLRGARLRQVAEQIRAGEIETAERTLARHMDQQPNDPDGLWLLAQSALHLGRRNEAATLLDRCLQLAPDFSAARYDYAGVLFQLHKFQRALAEINRLLAEDPRNPLFRQLEAIILETIGEADQTLAIREQLVAENPDHPESWVSYGHALRGKGIKEQSVAAYRKAIKLRPSCGNAYWALANMKTVRFSEPEIAAMREQSRRADIPADDRVPLQFALGKAYEDLGLFAKSFEEYAKANAAMRRRLGDSPEVLIPRASSNRAVFTLEFLSSRKNVGADSSAPIFIVGKPRSGTTLLEQILSSHSMIEGAGELPYISSIATRLREQYSDIEIGYPELLAKLDPAEFRLLGEEYLESAAVHCKLGRPFFVDKMPANHFHIGLIHLILPNAKIIDARRNPAACCFSMFKQYFSKTNLRLNELGETYRDYLAMMAHFERVFPHQIYRALYETIVENPEQETRKLFQFLGLPFEEACLRFYETKRTVLTPSSEQVRRPISGEAIDYWRNFEPWLGPLLNSLGSAFTAYPSVPEELA